MDHFYGWSASDVSEAGDLADQILTSKVANPIGAKVGDLGDLASDLAVVQPHLNHLARRVALAIALDQDEPVGHNRRAQD
jgi:hypothetical protein